MQKLMKRLNLPMILLYLLLFTQAFIFGAGKNSQQIQYFINDDRTADSNLTVHFLDVGQADCSVITCGDEVMMIDSGNADDYTYIDNYLDGLGIDEIDILVFTHAHEDHIGSGAQIVSNYEIGEIYMPEQTADTDIFLGLLDSIEAENYKISIPDYGKSIGFGSAEIQFFGTDEQCENINNSSIITRVSLGKTAFLFTGDAEYEAEYSLLGSKAFIESTVLKVGHHGAATSTGDAFLSAVSPSFAVISCGANNSYGHPNERTLRRLYKFGAEVFRTDRHGAVWAVSDGNSVKFSCRGFKNEDTPYVNRQAAA